MEARTENGHAEVGPAGHAPVPALPVRALKVFYAPGQLFEALRRRPLWGAALILGAVLVAASIIFIPTEIWQEMFRQQMLRSGRQMPEGFQFGGFARVFGLVGGVLFWFVLALFLTAVITLIFHLMLGDEGKFVQYLSVVAHALLIPAIGGLLIVPIKIAQRDPQMTLNLSLFIPTDSTAFPIRVLRALDLFQIWAYLVMAVGIAKVDARRSWGTAAAFLLVVALAMAILFAAVSPVA
jgi:hypothetical protein